MERKSRGNCDVEVNKVKNQMGAGINPMEQIQDNVYQHVAVLSTEIGERSIYHYENLEKTYEYIYQVIQRHGYIPQVQNYQFQNQIYRNVIVEKRGWANVDESIIVGAHYDTVYNTPGADDNASGVAALLELIRLFQNVQCLRTIRFVAFTLEEPPVFGSPFMGSQVYASLLKKRKENVLAMICLEMVGYYSEAEGTQSYPLPFMKLKYPDKGNFIGIVGNFSSRKLVKKVKKGIKRNCNLPVESIATSRSVPGVELSDQSSFWDYGYKAVMITDTAFYRNPNYHGPGDTLDTVNFDCLTELVKGLCGTIKELDVQRI